MQRLDITGYIGIVLAIVSLAGVYTAKQVARIILRKGSAGEDEEALEKYALAVRAVCLVLMIAAFVLVVVV